MQNTTEKRRNMGTRPGMAALRFMGWLELFVSLVLLVVQVPLIALFFALASVFMGSLALWINNRGEWYDRELGVWQTDDSPPPALEFTTRTALTGLVCLGLLAGAGVLLLTGGPTVTALVLVVWAVSIGIQMTRAG
jgi:hypothetical protein